MVLYALVHAVAKCYVDITMFEFEMTDVEKFEKKLKKISKTAIPFASKNMLNAVAFATRAESAKNLEQKMVLRNAFSKKSLRVEKTNTLKISQQESITGSIAPYLEKQEFGYTETKKGSHGVPIATTYASGEGEKARIRRRLPRKPNKMANISIRRKAQKVSNVDAIQHAAASGRKYVFLELKRSKGIFRIVGGKRKPRLKMVWDLSRPSVVAPANPWLGPATITASKQMGAIYEKSLMFQMNRLGITR